MPVVYIAAVSGNALTQRLHRGADTHCISDIDSGKLPEWENKPAPDIAKWYWKMPQVSLLHWHAMLMLCHALVLGKMLVELQILDETPFLSV